MAASYRGNLSTKSPTQTSSFLKQSYRAPPNCPHSLQERAEIIDETNHRLWAYGATAQLVPSSYLIHLLAKLKGQFSNKSKEISKIVEL